MANLSALPASGTGQFIQKTGPNTFANGTPAGIAGQWYQDELVASGTTGTVFNLMHVPSAILFLYKNGQYLLSGMGNDYTRAGQTITLFVSLGMADVLTANYS